MSEFGNDYITVTDEEGTEYELEHLDTLEHEGETYMAFASTDNEKDDEVEVIIFHVVEEDGEEVFESLDDEALLEEIYNMFMDRFAEEDDEEEV